MELSDQVKLQLRSFGLVEGVVDLNRVRLHVGSLLARSVGQASFGYHLFLVDASDAEDLPRLVHEFVHIEQRHRMGTLGFHFAYLVGQLRCGFDYARHPLERPALERQRLAQERLGMLPHGTLDDAAKELVELVAQSGATPAEPVLNLQSGPIPAARVLSNFTGRQLTEYMRLLDAEAAERGAQFDLEDGRLAKREGELFGRLMVAGTLTFALTTVWAVLVVSGIVGLSLVSGVADLLSGAATVTLFRMDRHARQERQSLIVRRTNDEEELRAMRWAIMIPDDERRIAAVSSLVNRLVGNLERP